jgi:hypothetical protein
MQMQKQTDAHRIKRRAELIEKGIEQLRRDLHDMPAQENKEANFSDNPPIDVEALTSEVESLRKRLAIWEIFLRYAKEGARTWPEVQSAVTPEDLNEINRICDGTPLRDLLMNLK